MAHLLVIDSSPAGEASVSRRLTAGFVQTWRAAHPGGTVTRRDLAAAPLPHLDGDTIAAFFTPADARSAAQRDRVAASDAVIAELRAADTIVLGVPMHNFGVPSTLKAWIDHAARAGETFRYTEAGPVGLLTGKKVFVLAARGGDYGAGAPAAAMNFVDPYLKAVLGFLGLADVTFVAAEGVATAGAETALAGAAARLEQALAA
ncbi:MAG: FMN-dependent NADH-azoreductase [Hyphomicrobiales bacterium]|nr:FMN-dependent NADH-azoreductase [Hyphomicrobiales bacterium]